MFGTFHDDSGMHFPWYHKVYSNWVLAEYI